MKDIIYKLYELGYKNGRIYDHGNGWRRWEFFNSTSANTIRISVSSKREDEYHPIQFRVMDRYEDIVFSSLTYLSTIKDIEKTINKYVEQYKEAI